MVAVCLAAAPSHAATDILGSKSGSVILPIVTPSVPRILHNAGADSNLIAVIFPLGAGADGNTYTLTRTSGTGNLDAYFYTDDDGQMGDICNPVPEDELLEQDTEVGKICPGASQEAGWGMVLLRWGLNAGFTIEW